MAQSEVKGEPQEHPPPTHCPQAWREPGLASPPSSSCQKSRKKLLWRIPVGLAEQSWGCVGSVPW